MNRTLKWFFSELQRWIDGGMRPHRIFNCYTAVCGSLNSWVEHTRHPDESYGEMREAMITLRKELLNMFVEEYCNINYPFNRKPGSYCSDVASYDSECLKETIYQNPQRLAFIRRQAA